MDHLPGLRADSRHELGMGVAKHVDGDTADHVEVAAAVRAKQPDALAVVDAKRDAHPESVDIMLLVQLNDFR
jgi:hypothetical protein